MAIPDPQTFKANTISQEKVTSGSVQVGSGYGKGISEVHAALEAYWENRASVLLIREQLLYNLWKVCGKWIKSRPNGHDSEQRSRRRVHVSNLRNEAMAELVVISPDVARALNFHQSRKEFQIDTLGRPYVGKTQLKGLSVGYDLERRHYLDTQKQSGSSLSRTLVEGVLSNVDVEPGFGSRNAFKRQVLEDLQQKEFSGLSVQDMRQLQRLFPEQLPPVLFLNKVARLRYMVTISDGLLCGSSGKPISMKAIDSHGQLRLGVYAMDKYGNLYVAGADDIFKSTEYVYSQGSRNYGVGETTQFNHSSFLAGAEVVCAGCLHIGHDNRHNRSGAGFLSAIDNNSGHYKPSANHLKACLKALKAQDVDVDVTRVRVYSGGGAGLFYWGRDFLNGLNAWRDSRTPPHSFYKPPPVELAISVG